jgi:small subunit ribosomal protein S21
MGGHRSSKLIPAEDHRRKIQSVSHGGRNHFAETRPKESNLKDVGIMTRRGVMTLAEVRLQEGESIDNALRRFKRKVQTEDIIKEVKRHSFYLKPGAKRRVKQALARKRARKKTRKESD